MFRDRFKFGLVAIREQMTMHNVIARQQEEATRHLIGAKVRLVHKKTS